MRTYQHSYGSETVRRVVAIAAWPVRAVAALAVPASAHFHLLPVGAAAALYLVSLTVSSAVFVDFKRIRSVAEFAAVLVFSTGALAWLGTRCAVQAREAVAGPSPLTRWAMEQLPKMMVLPVVMGVFVYTTIGIAIFLSHDRSDRPA
jgi:hypothetical protein